MTKDSAVIDGAAAGQDKAAPAVVYFNLPKRVGVRKDGTEIPTVKNVTTKDGRAMAVVTLPAKTQIDGKDAGFYQFWVNQKQVFDSRQSDKMVDIRQYKQGQDGKPLELTLTKNDEEPIKVTAEALAAAISEQRKGYLERSRANYERQKAYAIEHSKDAPLPSEGREDDEQPSLSSRITEATDAAGELGGGSAHTAPGLSK